MACSASRSGRRYDRKVRLPRLGSRRIAWESYRPRTGSFGGAGRRLLQVGRLGLVDAQERASKLEAKVAGGKARILSLTVRREGGGRRAARLTA